ncbi:MAG: hypothetical protein FJZ87_15485, partial [Chloroflexi bacterium]|nr:hypothetical protein [Chloroflexota bacterium]
MGAHPIRTRPREDQFDDVVQHVTREQDEPHPHAERRIDAPVNQRQYKKKEFLGPQVGEKTHRHDQPIPQSLDCDHHGYTEHDQGLHRILQRGFIGRELTKPAASLYTQSMKNRLSLESIIHPLGIWVRRGLPNRAWDWPAAGMTVALVLMASGRLMITSWVPSLEIVQTLSLYAVILGLVLGYSAFTPRNAIWAVFEYGILIIPFLLLRAVDGYESRYAALISIGARLLNSLKLFLTAEPVYDTLFFLCLTSIGFWIVGAYVGFSSARHRNYLNIVLPPGLSMLIVQLYDPWIPLRAWGLAFYLFTSLVLMGRLHYLERQVSWKAKRVFHSPESEGELSRSVLATAAILVFTAWALPGALQSIEPAAQSWRNFTKPIIERLSDAVSALDSPYGTAAGENFYGSMLNLGSNAPVSDAPVFHVEVGEAEAESPRYYWHGRTYDVYENGSWTNSNSVHQSFDPGRDEITPIEPFERTETQFQFTYNFPSQRLIYAPSELIWMDRRGQLSLDPLPGGMQDIHAWFTERSLTAGESYQVRAQIANPTILDLQDAGSDYPAWVTEKYLQVPQDLAPQLRELTEQITAPFGTPYGKTQAVTSYLRKEITYEENLTEGPPPNADPLMWVLFEHKKGFCMYYATAEVLMLRTIGIPARMAVGFAQGEYDPETDQFVVARRNSHAWPEVYFPGVGWVEFEPTANQDPLRRQRGNIEALRESSEGLEGTADSASPGEETPGG